MSVDEVETFLTILELGGFQKAAEKLNRSQPAISRRLGQLEARLGAPLLERAASGIALTDAGHAYLPHATAAIAALTDGDAAVRALLEPDRGWVSVALVGTLADTRILTTLREFAARAPSVELRLRTANSREVSELVSRGEAAVGLRYFEDSGEGRQKIGVDHTLVAVVSSLFGIVIVSDCRREFVQCDVRSTQEEQRQGATVRVAECLDGRLVSSQQEITDTQPHGAGWRQLAAGLKLAH